MSDLNTEISITANADGVEAGVGRAKKSLSSLGETAQKIGKNGADGMQALGAGADSSARKVDAATKNMVGSLQRQIAAMEAGDKTSRKYQETLARMRGVDVAALKPYLDQLDSLQNKTTLAERAQASFNSVMLKSAAVFATAGAIASYAKMINDGVDALNDLKDATGASIENISALEDVGKRAGASFDTVSTSLIKFNNVLSDAKPGSAAEQAIKALGLSIEDLKRLDPAEALRQTSVALNRFADDGDKARLVQELFGKSVKEVAPFLKDLAESGALVAKVTTEQAEQAEKFNKELAALGKNAQDASRALVGPMVSALNDVIAKFKEGREAGKSFLEIANSRYWSNIREFYGMAPPAAPSSGGASGSWGDGPDSKPSVGPLPDTKKPKGPTKAELSEYDKLIQRLGVDLPKAAAEAEAAQMGYNKAQAEFIALANSDVWGKFSNSQRANVAALFENKIVSEQAGEAAKTLAKANIDAVQAREKYLTSLATGIDKIKADIAAQEDATARMGLTKQAVADLDAAKLEMLATDAELQAIKALDRNLDQQTYDSLKEQAKLYRDLAAAKRTGAAKETALDLEKANEDAAKEAQREWQRTADEINRSLTDALLRGFESGKDFAKNLRDTVVNMFKTLVLRPIISAVVNPVAGAITGALGLAGAANAGTSALGAIGSAASGASFLGNAAGLLGGAGTAAGYGFSALMSGNGLGALSGGLSMLTSGGPAAIMAQGAGMIAGVLGPIALGIGALTAIIGKTKGETRTGGQFGVSFDGTVTNQRRDQVYTYQGQQFDRDFSNGQRNALIAGQAYRLEGDPVQNEQAIRDAVSGTASGINAFLKALGSKATLTGFSAGLETSSKGRGGVFAGGILSDGTTFGESGKGDNYAGTLYEKFSTNSPDFKTALENFTLDLKQSTIQALQSVTDIPETVKKMLKGVDAEGLSEEAANALLESINAQIVGVQNLTSAFEAMGLDKLAEMGFDAAAGLAAAAGGFDKLQGNLNTYYDNFYSDEEKRANLQKQVDKQFAELGIDVPKNREEFRRLVEGTLEQVDVQEKSRASLSKQINDAIAGAGKDGFTLSDAGARSIVSGINPALLGNAEADPALAGKLNGFLSGISDLAEKGLDPAAFQDGLAGLIDVNAEVLGIGKDASKTAATLLGLSGVFAQLNESAEETAARIAKEQADARDKALRGLERAIAKEKEALQSQIDVAQDVASTLSGLFDLLKSNVRDLYGEVDSTRAMLAAQGSDFITQALATARTTGYLPDETQLADAISAARGGLDSTGYSSQFELDRDRLVLAGKLAELEGMTGKQLTSAERTVKELEAQSKQLDQTLEYWQQQIDIANGTYEATLSVADAVKHLESLMFPAKGETGTLKPLQVGGGGSGGAGFGPGFGGGTSTPAQIDATTGKRTFSDGSVDYLTEGELDLYRRGILGKVTYFDVGTNYVPKDMLAVVHKGEQIVPAAYNPMLNPGMGGGGQTEALLAALLEQNARLETRLAAIEGHTQDTSRATNGNPISPVPMALVEDETV